MEMCQEDTRAILSKMFANLRRVWESSRLYGKIPSFLKAKSIAGVDTWGNFPSRPSQIDVSSAVFALN